MSNVLQENGWSAKLDLCMRHDGTKTRVHRRNHVGPLLIQKPFYPADGSCHIYLLHPPGGIVGGDQLHLNMSCHDQSHTLVTTPGATKFYRSNGYSALQKQTLNITDHAYVEWLPQENIFFNASQAQTVTRLNIAHQANFFAWEINCFGCPAGSQTFEQGVIRQRLELYRDQQPLIIERGRYIGGERIFEQAWGLANHSCSATLLASTTNSKIIDNIRKQIAHNENYLFSATLINTTLVCRYLGHHAQQARQVFTRVWRCVRPTIIGQQVREPRIWQT